MPLHKIAISWKIGKEYLAKVKHMGLLMYIGNTVSNIVAQ